MHIKQHDKTTYDNKIVRFGGGVYDTKQQDKNRALSQISSIVRSLMIRPEFVLWCHIVS